MRQTFRATRTHALVDSLEARSLFAVALGTNLIVNPGAEANPGVTRVVDIQTPSGWTTNGQPTAAKYGSVGAFPTSSSPGPSNRGKNFFAGGPNNTESDMFQTINLSSLSASIDSKKIKFNLAGYLGGSGAQGDNVTMFAIFHGSGGSFIKEVNIGPVSASARGNVTKLLSKSLDGSVPVGTRSVQLQLHFERQSGTYIDGYADNVSFIVNNTASTAGTVSGLVFKDSNGNGKQSGSDEKGLSNWLVYIDANNNAQYDPGESYALTNSAGEFKLTLKPGSYTVRVQVRSGYYETTPGALKYSVNVSAGGSITGEKFGVKPISAVT